jgi:N utilization substance protein B
MKKFDRDNPNSAAREYAVQFLYQCEREKIANFPENNFVTFVDHFRVGTDAKVYTRVLVEGTFANMPAIDSRLTAIAKNWSLNRMGATDRNVLRVAAYELMHGVVPRKVAINEAIEIAKRYGTEHSGSFVNGILDRF